MVFYPNYFLPQYICHLIIIILILVLMDTMQNPVPMEKQVGSICLADSTTTHTILYNRYFTYLSHCEGHVITISGITKLIEGFGRALILAPMGTEFLVKDALYSPQSQCNLLSFKVVTLF